MESKKAIVTFLDEEEGHKKVLVPLENLRELALKKDLLVVEIPSGRKLDIEDIEENMEVIIIPQACGG